MKTIRYSFLSILLALLTALAAGAETVTFERGNLNYKIDLSSEDAYVLGVSTTGAASSSISIPTYVEYNGTKYRIAQINSQAFKGNTRLIYLSIAWGTTYIMNEAFAGCTNLATVHIPSSASAMYNSVFAGCTSLKEVYYSSVHPKAINANIFPNNSGMTLHIPNGCDVSTSSYKNLTGFTMFTNVVTDSDCHDFGINYGTGRYYYGCIEEQDVRPFSKNSSVQRKMMITGANESTSDFSPADGTLPNTIRFKVTNIAANCCYGNTSIKSVNLSNCPNLEVIGQNAFKNCTGLTTANVYGNEVKYEAFSGCSNLTTFTLNEGITTLGNSIVSGTPLTQLSLPASLTAFNYAADGAKSLISIAPHADNPTYTSVYGTLYSKDKTRLIRQPEGRSLITFTDNLTTIAAYAFQDCYRITELEIPYGVTSINSYAFLRASALKNISFPGSVTSYSNNFLQGCTALTDLYINKNTPPAMSMSQVFGSSSAPTIVPNVNLHVPYNKEADYKTAGWTGFKSYNANNVFAYDFSQALSGYGTAYYSILDSNNMSYQDEDDEQHDANGTVRLQSGVATTIKADIKIPTTVSYRGKCYGVTTLGEYAFPNSGTLFSISGGWLVSDIASWAAYSNSNISSVNLPNIKNIGDYAFAASSANYLHQFHFPSSLESIGENAFIYAKIEGDVILPYGIKKIGDYAFYNCNGISRMVVPSSVTTLGKHFASACYGMQDLNINLPTKRLSSDFALSAAASNQVTRVPVGQVEQWKKIIGAGKNVEAGAFDFIWGNNYSNYYHMSVMATITGDFTDPETGVKTHYDGWASYVYHPNIKAAEEFTIDYIETDRITGKKFLMVELGDSVLAGTTVMEQISGPTASILTIGHHAFEGCAVQHDLTFNNPIIIGEQAFTEMPNCPSVTILTPLDMSTDFDDSYIFDHNKDGFKFYIDNAYFKKAYDYCLDWDMNDGEYAAQLRPFIRAEGEVQPVSCYLEWVDYATLGEELGFEAHAVTGYDESKKTLKTTKLIADNVNYNENGVVLTGLTKGQIYKLEPFEGDVSGMDLPQNWDNYLTRNWVGSTYTPADELKRWYWDSEASLFKHPTSDKFVPGGSALLFIGDSDPALEIDEWTLEFASGGNKFDVNSDTKVDVGDVNAVLEAILAGKTDDKFNVNGDTGVDVGDVNAILEYILTH